jgi:putative oxidoreductase
MNVLALTGRIFFSLIFLAAGLSDFGDATINYAGAQGIALPYLLIPLSGIFSVLGALSILLGFKTKAGSWLIIIFLLPVTFATNKFWLPSSDLFPVVAQADAFIKDLSVLSGALVFAYFGAGKLSFDAKATSSTSEETGNADFTYILDGHNSRFFSNDHSL